MNNKLIFIFGSLLFIFGVVGFCTADRLTDNAISKITGGHSGPCGGTGSNCGGTDAYGNCSFNLETGQCEGYYIAACPEGRNWSCKHKSGPCWKDTSVSCNTRNTYRCAETASGLRCIPDPCGVEACGGSRTKCHD